MTRTAPGLTLPDSEKYAAAWLTMAGWFDWLDVRLFDALMSVQNATDVQGDMLEIGCYQGKSAVLLGYGCRTTETVVVCDPFDKVSSHADVRPLPADADPAGDYLANLRVEQFLVNWDQHHYWRPDIRACESSELDLGKQEFRMLHVDGCHSYPCVARDIGLAAAHTAPLGIIAVDDYRNAQNPGVAAATWEAVGMGRIHPFCTSGEKLYATAAPEDQEYWVQIMRTIAVPQPWQWDVYSFPGYDVVRTFDKEPT